MSIFSIKLFWKSLIATVAKQITKLALKFLGLSNRMISYKNTLQNPTPTDYQIHIILTQVIKELKCLGPVETMF